MQQGKAKVAIVGSGLIGSCWATLFSSGGYDVVMYDVNNEALALAKQRVRTNLDKLEKQGLSRGPSTADEAFARVTTTLSLEEAVTGAVYVQESTVETREFKEKIFEQMDAFAGEKTILASSTSTIPASLFTANLKNRARCIVSHPVNPPLYLTLTEVVPAPWTSADTVEETRRILSDIGQDPVVLKKEVLGFAVNRIQYAILAESWRLVSDGVMSADDVDKVMSSGLGPRYALHGPFETIHMNADGIADYCARYAKGMQRVLSDFGTTPSFEEAETITEVAATIENDHPRTELTEDRSKREQFLASVALLKRNGH